MDQILRRAAELFTTGTSAEEAFCIAQAEARYDEVEATQMILDLKWPWVLEALGDPMEPDYEALGNQEPTSQYADSQESAEAPAVQ